MLINPGEAANVVQPMSVCRHQSIRQLCYKHFTPEIRLLLNQSHHKGPPTLQFILFTISPSRFHSFLPAVRQLLKKTFTATALEYKNLTSKKYLRHCLHFNFAGNKETRSHNELFKEDWQGNCSVAARLSVCCCSRTEKKDYSEMLHDLNVLSMFNHVEYC